MEHIKSNKERGKAPVVLQRGQHMPSNEQSRSDRVQLNGGGQYRGNNYTADANRNDNRRNDNGGRGARREEETYGVIATIKANFGFIQPVIGEEQLYFSDRDFYENMKVGDKVGYHERRATKGLQADAVRFLAPHLEKLVPSAKGTIVRLPDRHRNVLGLLEVDLTGIKPEVAAVLERGRQIPFRHNDVVESSIPKNFKLDKGDNVEISISRVHDSSLLFACNVKLLAVSKERRIAVQIQRMLDAGAVREQGVVSTLKRGEYGFIRAADRKDEIYFRQDDAVEEEDPSSRLVEGSEVEFFVIVESIKGKLSDRATLLTSLPKGTVKFEYQLATKVLATVVEENASYPSEAPGKLRLQVPVSSAIVTGTSRDTVDTIELWQRCLPEELQCRVGDELWVDVQYYRPEKLYFARSVKVASFRKIGREYGSIVSVKEHFGFINSQSRGLDLYFKTAFVANGKGEVVSESALKPDTLVSFDVVIEDSNQGSKLRAQRVRVEEAADAIADIRKQVIKKDLLGIVVRNATRKDAPGLIKVHPASVNDVATLEFVNHDLIDRLTSFHTNPDIRRVQLFGLPVPLQRAYSLLLEKQFPGIVYDQTVINERDGSNFRVFSMTKVEPAEYQRWQEGRRGGSNAASPVPAGASREKSTHLQFFKEDYESLSFGPLANDLKVVFDLCWDTSKQKKVARSIRLTDESVSDAPERRLGVMEVVVEKEKDEPYGFLRCLTSDEKLFWHCSETFLPYGQDLKTGTDVSFMIKRRGGMRCAVDIEVLKRGENSKETVLPEQLTGIVVEEGQVLLTDVSRSAVLNTKYADLRLLHESTSVLRETKSDKVVSWERLGLLKTISDDALGLGDGSEAPAGAGGFVTVEDVAVDVSGATGANGLSPVPATPNPEQSEDSEFTTEYKAKYFGSIPRLSVPVREEGKALTVGDVVTCQAVVNLGVQRAPLAVVGVASAGEAAVKRRGRISRLRFRVKPIANFEEAFLNYSLATVDFAEIALDVKSPQEVGSTPAPEGTYSGLHYYCDSKELRLVAENKGDLIQVGDEVDFWTTAAGGNAAFHAVLVPKASPKEIQFKRGAVNAELKVVKAKTGSVNLITMAMGPPSDSSTGFDAGWRPVPSVAGLPWAHLLSHVN